MQFTVTIEHPRAAVREKEHIKCLLAARRHVTSCSDTSAANETRVKVSPDRKLAAVVLENLLNINHFILVQLFLAYLGFQ